MIIYSQLNIDYVMSSKIAPVEKLTKALRLIVTSTENSVNEGVENLQDKIDRMKAINIVSPN